MASEAVKDSKEEQVDEDGNSGLHTAAANKADYEQIKTLIEAGADPNLMNKAGDAPLHIAAKAGNVEACRALLDGGADCLKRNGKNRKPREVPKIPESTKQLLADAEEEAKERKRVKESALWDDKMRATQTDSALAVRFV